MAKQSRAPTFCYWSVASGEYARLMGGLIASARGVGVKEEFHVWTDGTIPGAVCHPAGHFDNWGWLFKLLFLRDEVRKLSHDYMVYLDSDNWFVRHPGDVLRVVNGGPMHVTLESDLTTGDGFPYWWEYSTALFVELMRSAGVQHPGVYAVNGGMFIVHRDAIDEVYTLADQFWLHCKRHGVLYVDEPLLSYAMHRLCRTTEPHTLEATSDLWATDFHGIFKHRVPRDEPFPFRGLYRRQFFNVQPAIVHAFKSKKLLMEESVRLLKATARPASTPA